MEATDQVFTAQAAERSWSFVGSGLWCFLGFLDTFGVIFLGFWCEFESLVYFCLFFGDGFGVDYGSKM